MLQRDDTLPVVILIIAVTLFTALAIMATEGPIWWVR